MTDQGRERLQRRVLAFTAGIGVLFTAVFGQLVNLQVVENRRWATLAEGNRVRRVPIAAPRGNIFDRHGLPLATTRPVFVASLLLASDPRIDEQTVPRLARILSWDRPAEYEGKLAEIREKIRQHKREVGMFEPVRLATDISPEVHTRLEESRSELPGVHIEVQPVREYVGDARPEVGAMPFAHVLGYVQNVTREDFEDPQVRATYKPTDIIGRTGLEAQYERELRGQDGGRMLLVDAHGRFAGELETVDPTPGRSLVLTIDKNLQVAAWDALQAKMRELRAKRVDGEGRAVTAHAAALVAIAVKTGEVLAMVSAPSFDPNDFAAGRGERTAALLSDGGLPLLNRAIGGEYAPGSTYKLVTATAGLEEGRIAPSEVIVSTDRYWRPPFPREWWRGGLGPLTVAQAIGRSSNVFFFETGWRLGPDLLHKWAEYYGFGKKTGIDLPGELPGRNPSRASYGDQWFPGIVLSLAIGQGDVQVTMLQLANYVATIANGGTLRRPFLVREVRDSQGRLLRAFGPTVLGTVPASAQTNALLRQGMRNVVSEWPIGTTNAFYYPTRFEVPVGGKTGSAEIGGGRTENGLFAAFAPYDDPEIAVALVIEGGGGGAQVSGVAREVFKRYFTDRGVIQPPKADARGGGLPRNGH